MNTAIRLAAPAAGPVALMIGVHLRRFAPAYALAFTIAHRRRLYRGRRQAPVHYRGKRRNEVTS